MANVYEYEVGVNWQGGLNGMGVARGHNMLDAVPLGIPIEFKGTGGGSNPEELLTAAIASCYAMTYGVLAEERGLEVVDLETHAVGEVEGDGERFVYKRIVVRPRIQLEKGANEAMVKHAEELAHSADAECVVTNAVRATVQVVIEPEIVVP